MSMGDIDLGPIGVWTATLDQVPSARATELAAEIEELGYGAIWIPEAVGRDPFELATLLLAGTSSIPDATAERWRTLAPVLAA
jgi:alkanesulfonate monooxygenase SsuD/methylene tetrahydromethanopterin reductase-like flavin-dependent oxidoreductase (luciferase family)